MQACWYLQCSQCFHSEVQADCFTSLVRHACMYAYKFTDAPRSLSVSQSHTVAQTACGTLTNADATMQRRNRIQRRAYRRTLACKVRPTQTGTHTACPRALRRIFTFLRSGVMVTTQSLREWAEWFSEGCTCSATYSVHGWSGEESSALTGRLKGGAAPHHGSKESELVQEGV